MLTVGTTFYLWSFGKKAWTLYSGADVERSDDDLASIDHLHKMSAGDKIRVFDIFEIFTTAGLFLTFVKFTRTLIKVTDFENSSWISAILFKYR